MREMSATEAARNFSAVLDAAENGDSVVVVRGGQRVAMIVPVPRANAGSLRAVFDKWRGDPACDDRFVGQVAAGRDAVSAELDSDPWRD
jgi:prevent-host-death family protein